MGTGKGLVCREELALLGMQSLAQPHLQQHGPLGGVLGCAGERCIPVERLCAGRVHDR